MRLSLVYGRDERSVFGRMVTLVNAFPMVPVVGPGTYEVQPVHVDDVCGAIQRCLETPVTVGRSYVLAGREPTTFNQLVDLILAAQGRHKTKVHIPEPVALLMARARLKGGESEKETKELMLLWLTSIGWDQRKAKGFVSRVVKEASSVPPPPTGGDA